MRLHTRSDPALGLICNADKTFPIHGQRFRVTRLVKPQVGVTTEIDLGVTFQDQAAEIDPCGAEGLVMVLVVTQ